MKISDFVSSFFSGLGVNTAFSITGGAAMHLNDSIGQNEEIRVVYMHNEQSCAMAAEGYARISRMPALVVVTAGPGSINAFNGVFGAYTDSIPMIILSGQARKNTQKEYYGLSELRQLGDQEAPVTKMVSHITKACFEIFQEDSSSIIKEKLSEAFSLAVNGRPGPVWIEIPVDVQAIDLDFSNTGELPSVENELIIEGEQITQAFEAFQQCERPVIVLGSGVQIAGVAKEAVNFAEQLNIPVLTAWSHDSIPSSHELFVGRPGTIGSRPGNIILQSADFVLVLGSRLNIRQTSYNYENFASKATIVQVDVDSAELRKPFPRVDIPVHADLKNFFASPNLTKWATGGKNSSNEWLQWCKEIKAEFDIRDSDYPIRDGVINPYHLVPHIIDSLQDNAIIVCGNATACIVPFQTATIRSGMNMFSNSGSASMGYDLPAAIGAAIAAPDRPVLCFAGDGSLMMNIQELQTIAKLQLNICTVVLENGGYLSIKQTQSNFFNRYHGATEDSGVSFPDFNRVIRAFGIEGSELSSENWKSEVASLTNSTGPKFLLAHLDRDQEFEPRLKSKLVDGKIQTPTLDDMFPHLPHDVLHRVRGAHD